MVIRELLLSRMPFFTSSIITAIGAHLRQKIRIPVPRKKSDSCYMKRQYKYFYWVSGSCCILEVVLPLAFCGGLSPFYPGPLNFWNKEGQFKCASGLR